MQAITESLLPETTLCRTRRGTLALVDRSHALSPAFRRLLRRIDGTQCVQDLLDQETCLDAQDLEMWLEEMLRMGLIAVRESITPDDMAFQLTGDLSDVRHEAAAPPGPLADLQPALPPGAPTVAAPASAGSVAHALPDEVDRPAAGDDPERSSFFVFPDLTHPAPAEARICVASPDALTRSLAERVLKLPGIQTVCCATRQELQACLRGTWQPHVLLVDGLMPRLNPYRLLEHLSTRQELGRMQVVLMSAHGERADLARALMLGAAGYVVTPLQAEALLAAVSQLVGRPLRTSLTGAA